MPLYPFQHLFTIRHTYTGTLQSQQLYLATSQECCIRTTVIKIQGKNFKLVLQLEVHAELVPQHLSPCSILCLGSTTLQMVL